MHFNLKINFKLSSIWIFYQFFSSLKSWPTHILIHKREMITLTRNILRIIIATKQKNVFRGSAAVIVVVHISWMLKTETFVQLCSIFRQSINSSLWSFPISFFNYACNMNHYNWHMATLILKALKRRLKLI